MENKAAYTNEEIKVCLRLQADIAVMDWFKKQADAMAAFFPLVSPDQLPALQTQTKTILALISRIEGGVRASTHARVQAVAQQR